MSLTDIDQVSWVYSVPPVGHASLTVFAEGKVRHSAQPSELETRHTDEQFSASLSSEKTVQSDRSWLVKAIENITIAPRCRQIVLGKLDSEKGQTLPPLVCVEPAQIAIEGIFSARALSRVELGTQGPSRVTSPGSQSNTSF
jgi:hypothetical protein